MKVYIGADHRGFKTKEVIREFLIENNHTVEDMGAYQIEREDDYVDYAKAVAEKVAFANQKEKDTRGIVICGSAVGVDIVANKIKGIRCGLGFSPEQVHSARKDDDINILAIPNDYLSQEATKKIITSFLLTEFHPIERYIRRINKIKELEK